MQLDLCALSCCAVAALGSVVQAQTVPTYSTETRWTVNTVIPATGATSITLTLQGRAVFDGAFPTDTPSSLYGNFGIAATAFNPSGSQGPMITRSDSSVILRRGDWPSYLVNTSTGEQVDWVMRGGAPGDYNPATRTFTRMMRSGLMWPDTNFTDFDPNGPGPNTGTGANGSWNAAADMLVVLFRSDFQAAAPQPRELDPLAWQDLYRIRVDTPGPVVLGAGGFTVAFDGWIRAAGASTLVGSNWTLQVGAGVLSSASIGFVSVPSPAATTLVALGWLVAQRRRTGR